MSEHFWSKVSREGDCWEWQASCRSTGYGQFYIKRKSHQAHRVAYELTKGEIPTGLMVLHSCDNRRCVNPDHLRVGTHAENMQDRNSRGRTCAGERVGTAKLSMAQVEEIRNRAQSGESQKSLAATFGVSRATIHLIVNHERWK